jgi:hypothetical protein
LAVIVLALLLIAFAGYSALHVNAGEGLKLGTIILIAAMAGLGLGVLWLRAWAWWVVVLVSAFLAFTGVVGFVDDVQRGEWSDLALDAVFLAVGLSALLPFLSSPVKRAFAREIGLEAGFPPFRLDVGCVVVLVLAAAFAVLVYLAMLVACAHGNCV